MITALQLGSRARMLAFCAAVQAASPVGSYITPTPGAQLTGNWSCVYVCLLTKVKGLVTECQACTAGLQTAAS